MPGLEPPMNEQHPPNEPHAPPDEAGLRFRPAPGPPAERAAAVPSAPSGPPADTGTPPPGEGAGGWTIRRKLQGSFAVMILLIAVLGGMGIYSISRLRDISTVLSDQ